MYFIGIFREFLRILQFQHKSVKIMDFLLFLWKCSSPGPGTGNVDIPIGILMILGCVSPQKSTFPHKTWYFLKFYNFQEILWISWIPWFPRFSHKIMNFYKIHDFNGISWNSCFPAPSAPSGAMKWLRNYYCFLTLGAQRAQKRGFHQKSWNSRENP